MLCALRVDLDDPAALAVSPAPGADALLLDLGDAAVDPGKRAARRAAALDLLDRVRLTAGGPASPAAVVRIAPLASGLADADLDAVMAGAPSAVLLPGAVGGRDLQHLAAKLAVREAEHGLTAGRTRIVAAPADTAAGVLALPTLAGATPRLLALVWEPGGLRAALRVAPDASPLRTARDLLLVAAAAAGVPALDLPERSALGGARGGARDAACAGARRGAAEHVRIAGITPDHPGVDTLRGEAAGEQFLFLDRLVGDWASGANRFDRPGEGLLGASIDGRLVGLGGLNRDPHASSDAVGRLRHLYVSPAARRRGVGAALVASLLAVGRPVFSRVRLRTDTAPAAVFYEAQGFAPCDESACTHAIALR